MRIGIVGAGAMGGVFGAALARAEHETILFDVNRAHLAAIAERGLTIDGPDGARDVHRLAVAVEPAALGALDVAVVLVDSANTRAAAEIAAGALKPSGSALTLQNGIGNVEALIETLGAARVLAGSTYVSAAYLGPGHIRHSNVGETLLGQPDGAAGARAAALAADLARVGLPARAVPNVMGHVWMKFALNCAINPICAATGLRPGEVMRIASARRALETALDEILAVARADGIDLPSAAPRDEILEHARTRYNRPSMLQHVEAGRTPEIPALNGALVAAGERLGVPTPANRMLADLVPALAERVRRRLENPDIDEAALEAQARRAEP
jgi:2-dehydropantoate 2-reductase